MYIFPEGNLFPGEYIQVSQGISPRNIQRFSKGASSGYTYIFPEGSLFWIYIYIPRREPLLDIHIYSQKGASSGYTYIFPEGSLFWIYIYIPRREPLLDIYTYINSQK